MESNYYITILIFSLSLLSLAFTVGLWLTRPKTNKSQKNQLKKKKKTVQKD